MSFPIMVDDHPLLMSRLQMFLLLCLVVLAMVAIGLMTVIEWLGWPFVRLYRRFS